MARSGLPVTHELLDEFPPGQALSHVRGMLVHSGVIAERNEYLERITPWLDQLLEHRPAHHVRLIRPFAHWHVLLRARRNARQRRITYGSSEFVKSRIRSALHFLTWLDGQEKSLDTLRQEDIDRWLVSGPHERYAVRCFMDWAVRRGIVGSITVPAPRHGHPVRFIDEDRYTQLLRRCVNDVDLPVDVRVAGALVLLFGVTVQRVLQLRLEDLNCGNGSIDIRLGDKPVRLPPRLAQLVLELAESPRDRSAVSRAVGTTQFLFPGRVPGRPAHAAAFANKLNRHEIKITEVRNTARITLALDLPAAVLADLFDMHINTAVRWVQRAKRDWSTYIAARAEDLNHEWRPQRLT
ncbi:hypothetical protein ABZT43_36750 [Streptomyces sp. NPDC005349]|uniref:hypothetical protein n=1 Tax=Streptomyces sp. NPDC005349 TaxID=3157037 RepID=UPI0033B7FA2A